MKKFFASLNLTYCTHLLFDQNDLYTQRYIQKIIDLSDQDIINKKIYSGQINYKGYVEKKKPLLKIDYISKEVGYGIFAEQEFNKDDFIGEYCGIVTSNYHESSKNYNYKYFSAINEEENIFIAPRKIGNELQFVNHSNNPNVEWKTIVGNDDKYHVIMVAIKHIKKEEQILVDYGKEYWDILGINPLETA